MTLFGHSRTTSFQCPSSTYRLYKKKLEKDTTDEMTLVEEYLLSSTQLDFLNLFQHIKYPY